MTGRKGLLILGLALIIIGITSLLPLYFMSIPEGNKDILSMGIGVILGWGSSAVAYYFTSDKDR
mgnify:CR=1 FL=1